MALSSRVALAVWVLLVAIHAARADRVGDVGDLAAFPPRHAVVSTSDAAGYDARTARFGVEWLLRGGVEHQLGLEWPLVVADESSQPLLHVEVRRDVASFLRATAASEAATASSWESACSASVPHQDVGAVARHAEGYLLWAHQDSSREVSVRLVASSSLAATMGLGRLLREVVLASRQWQTSNATSSSPVAIPASLCVAHAPPAWFHTRGHQFTDYGFAFTPWPSAGAQYVRDLVAFGTNQIEMAHIDWARGDLAKMVTYSKLLNSLDVNMSAWYPINLYTTPGGVQASEAMFQQLPRFDSLFVPGGDGGEVLAPAQFVATVGNLTKLMRTYHPSASVWVSAQDYSMANLTAFMGVVARPDVRQWLSGIVYGPHVHVPLAQFLDMAPDGVPVRQYPDLCHMIESQFEVPRWDPAFTLTYRRLAVSPSPRRFYDIVTLRTNATYTAHSLPGGSNGHLIGFGAYSEGTSDDLNKVIWSVVGSDGVGLEDAVHLYAAYFFEPAVAGHMEDVLFGLETNWDGPLARHGGRIAATLSSGIAALEAASPSHAASNWRLHMNMLRCYFDAVVAARQAYGLQTVAQVRQLLSAGSTLSGVHAALQSAQSVLATRHAAMASDPALAALYRGVSASVAAINATVTAFVLCDQQPDLSLGTINATITDVAYFDAQVADALALASPAEQLAYVQALLRVGTAPAGGFYDLLGSVDADDHPHLVVGQGARADPAFYYTSLQGADTDSDEVVPPTTRRLAQRSYSLAFFDASLTLRYTDLDTTGLSGYNVSVLLWSSPGTAAQSHAPTLSRLTVNGAVCRNYAPAPSPMALVSCVVQAEDVDAHGGVLEVACNQPPGLSGSGRCCFMSEVYVSPMVAV